MLKPRRGWRSCLTTSEALASGEIPVGHARLIARASGESPIDESVLVEAANEQPFDEFARTVKRHQQEVADDDGQALLDRQRRKRKARIFESPESGMFVLSGEFDQITGARIATALTAKERQLWHREDPNKRATPQQRMADALAELICEPASGRSAGTDLLVIADFDVIKQQLDNPASLMVHQYRSLSCIAWRLKPTCCLRSLTPRLKTCGWGADNAPLLKLNGLR